MPNDLFIGQQFALPYDPLEEDPLLPESERREIMDVIVQKLDLHHRGQRDGVDWYALVDVLRAIADRLEPNP